MVVAQYPGMTTCAFFQRMRQSSRTTRRIATRAFAIGAIAAAALLFGATTPALAQQPGLGVRAGVSASPDQFYFGAHYDTGPLFDKLSFRPNAEIGVGNDNTTVAGNFEFVYWWPIRRHPWNIYAGGGPAVVYYHHGNPHNDHEGDGSVNPGFNILFGAAHHSGFFTEIKIGFIDSPEFKFGVGWTWR
ncbi:MAG: hypothetical protein ACM3NQ_01925 [Bacteroidales bacterium]